jgi:hypothetical protein
VKLTYNDCTNCIKTNLGRSEWSETSRRVTRKCPLSNFVSAVMVETVNEVIGENKRPNMRTLIFAHNEFIWGKDKKETKEKLNQRNIIIKD